MADTFKIQDFKITARAEVVMDDGSIAVVTLAPTELLGNWSAVAIETPDGSPISGGAISALRRIEEAAGLALWADGVRIDRPIEVTRG